MSGLVLLVYHYDASSWPLAWHSNSSTGRSQIQVDSQPAHSYQGGDSILQCLLGQCSYFLTSQLTLRELCALICALTLLKNWETWNFVFLCLLRCSTVSDVWLIACIITCRETLRVTPCKSLEFHIAAYHTRSSEVTAKKCTDWLKHVGPYGSEILAAGD